CIGTLRPRVPHPLPTRRSSDLLGNDAVPLCGDHHSVIGVEPWGDAGVTPPHPDVALGDLSTSLTRGGPGLGHLSHRDSPRGTGPVLVDPSFPPQTRCLVLLPDLLLLSLDGGPAEDQYLYFPRRGDSDLGLGVAHSLLAGGVVDPHRNDFSIQLVHGAGIGSPLLVPHVSVGDDQAEEPLPPEGGDSLGFSSRELGGNSPCQCG